MFDSNDVKEPPGVEGFGVWRFRVVQKGRGKFLVKLSRASTKCCCVQMLPEHAGKLSVRPVNEHDMLITLTISVSLLVVLDDYRYQSINTVIMNFQYWYHFDIVPLFLF